MRRESRRMWIGLGLLALVMPLGATQGRDDEFTPEEDFTCLYNGKDLSGWRLGAEALDGKAETADHRFAAKGDAIVIQGAAKIEDLYTVREFNRDFVLRLQFRAGPRANSGLYLRGTQLQVRDYATIGPYTKLKQFHREDWNDIEVTVKADANGEGAVAECTCNGEMLEKALRIPAKGGIGLQSEAGQLEYRRIRIKEQP
jgi:hypothetical protein